MKQIKFIFSAIIIGTMICAGPCFAQCKAKQIMKACKPNINTPFRYDSYAVNEFTFDKKARKIELQFTAFQGMKYKIVFCASGFDEQVKMNIFDKSNKVKNNRHQLYDNSQGVDNNFWSFDPPKSGNYFIEYDVPPSNNGVTKQGCVVMLIAFTEETK